MHSYRGPELRKWIYVQGVVCGSLAPEFGRWLQFEQRRREHCWCRSGDEGVPLELFHSAPTAHWPHSTAVRICAVAVLGLWKQACSRSPPAVGATRFELIRAALTNLETDCPASASAENLPRGLQLGLLAAPTLPLRSRRLAACEKPKDRRCEACWQRRCCCAAWGQLPQTEGQR